MRMNISQVRKSYTERLEIIHEKSFIFGLKLLIFDSLGLFDPNITKKISLVVFLKFSPEKTDDFRFLRIEKITFHIPVQKYGLFKIVRKIYSFEIFCTYSGNNHHKLDFSVPDLIFKVFEGLK